MHFFFKIIPFLCIAGLYNSVSAQEVNWKPFLTDTTFINRKLNLVFESTEIPATGAIIVKSDTVSASMFRGRNKKHGEVLNDQNWIHLGSNTMHVTSYLAARLVHEGKIQWNTDFFQMFPKLLKKAHSSFENQPVTLEMLLSHRAGIVPFASAKEFDLAAKIKGKGSKRNLKFAELVFSYPRLKAEFTFSNAGYTLAMMMLEKASGKNWNALLKQYLFEDLGIAYFVGMPQEYSEFEAWGHFTNPNDTVFNQLPPSMKYRLPEVLNPAINLSMKPKGYARFIQHILQGIQGKTVLPAELFHKLCLSNDSYAMGWVHMEDHNGTLIILHDGISGFHFMRTTLVPEMDFGMSVYTNTFGGDTEGIINMLNQDIIEKKIMYEELKPSGWQRP